MKNAAVLHAGKKWTVKEIKQFSFYICIYSEINSKILGFCNRETYFGGINKLLERRWGGMSGTVLEWGKSLKWNGFGEFKRRVTGSKKVLSLSSAVLQEAYIEHISESSNKIRSIALFPVLHKRLLEDVGVNLHSSCANYPVYYKFAGVKCWFMVVSWVAWRFQCLLHYVIIVNDITKVI